MSAYIEIRDAVKMFRDNCALDHVTLSLEQGQIHGIVGRNGSGKTVLMKCICGFMELTGGEILVRGEKVKPSKPQAIGLIIETPGFIGKYSGYKNLKYLAMLSSGVRNERIREVMQMVGLDPDNRKPVRQYSLGMRQRLGIAQAIMEDHPLLLLDEPMNGLDNKGVEEMRAVFLKLKEEGKTILLASHGKEDIALLCDTVTELDHGCMIQFRAPEISEP